MSRLPQLRQCLSVRRAEIQHGDAPANEMRYVLRPHFGRFETDVRQRLPDGRDFLRNIRANRSVAPHETGQCDGKFYAYGQKCTHLSCPVYYAKENDRLECPCHEGGFNVQTGNVLYGPPPRPLDKIEIEERGGEIWAIGREASQDGHTI